MDCPVCGDECWRDEVDVGVGVIYGPYGCSSCGWSEADLADLREQYPGMYVDPQGGVHDIDRIVERAERFSLDGAIIREAFEDVKNSSGMDTT